MDGTGYDLDDVETILADMERDTFEIDDNVANFDDDEKDVTINIGRYKFKVVAEDFYEWEEMAQSSSNSKDVVDIIEFIKKSLGFTT